MPDTAVVTLVNDKYAYWFAAFLESFREFNPSIPLFCIPYDDKVNCISEWSSIYDFTMIEYVENDKLNIIFRELLDKAGERWRMARKLLAFQLPCDEFIYLDADRIILHSINPLQGISHSDLKIIFGNYDKTKIYKDASHFYKHNPRQFQCSMFSSSKNCINLDEIYYYLNNNRAIYSEELNLHGMDQVMLTHYTLSNNLNYKIYYDFQNTVSATFSYKYPYHYVEPYYLSKDNLPIISLHYGGVRAGSRNFYKHELHTIYATRAINRLHDHGITVI